MALLRRRRGAYLFACGISCAFALACSSSENSHARDTASTGGGGSSATLSQRASDPGHAGGAGGKAANANPMSDSAAGTRNGVALTGDSGAGAGAGGAGGAAGAVSDVDQAHQECTFGETCVSKCTATTVSCGIELLGFACEFSGFVGASTTVACGERATIGTACCGGCGCVPVEVYFDGKHCWQGLPQCTIDQFTNKVFDPHDPMAPDAPPFTPPSDVPGSFTLGTAGTGAAANAGGAGGSVTTISGGSGGSVGGRGSIGEAGADSGGSADSTKDAGAPVSGF